jgi:hypothetical protein
MHTKLQNGLTYTKELLANCQLPVSAELKGEPSPTSLVILDQAVVYHDHEEGKWKVNLYSAPLTLLQIRRMFGVGSGGDSIPKGNVVPCEDIFDAIRRGIMGVFTLRFEDRVTRLAANPNFAGELDRVQDIPEKARPVDFKVEDQSNALALPGFAFDPKDLPPLMRDRLAQEDWSKAYPVYALKEQYTVDATDLTSHIVGDVHVPRGHYHLRSASLAGQYTSHRENIRVRRFEKGLAVPGYSDHTDVWFFEFGPRASIKRIEGLNAEELEKNFVRRIEGQHKIRVELHEVTQSGFKFHRKKQPTVTLEQLQLLAEDNFILKLPLAPGVAKRFKKGEIAGLCFEVHPTAINPRAEILIAYAGPNALARIQLSTYVTALRQSQDPANEKLHIRTRDAQGAYGDIYVTPTITPEKQKNRYRIAFSSSGNATIDQALTASLWEITIELKA